MSNKTECGCDQAKALQSELAELRAAAYPVLAWVARNGGGRAAVERLERALAVGAREAEPEVVARLFDTAETGHRFGSRYARGCCRSALRILRRRVLCTGYSMIGKAFFIALGKRSRCCESCRTTTRT